MTIKFIEETKIFNLRTPTTSYIIKILDNGYLAHLYWGKAINTPISSQMYRMFERCSFSPNPIDNDSIFSLDTAPLEYPSYGNSDYRTPALELEFNDGSTVSDFKYYSHCIINGKPILCGLPSTYVEDENEATTLEITLKDSLKEVYIKLIYTVFEKIDVITRSVNIINTSNEDIRINRVLSANVDFHQGDFDILTLQGYWAKERHLNRTPISNCNTSIFSQRGSSSHVHNPFMAILDKNANEDFGNVYAFNLVYSGNFIASAELNSFNNTRALIGINPFDFSWLLTPSESFQAPEVVMVYSDEGLGKMSRIYHSLYKQRLCRGIHRDKKRPILINNWEATYFDFNSEKIENLAKEATSLGIEMLVLDDGWFGERNSDQTSLGDWFVNAKKLPNGLKDLAEKINEQGLKFGLWFEPEMISPDSELYRKHPDWCLHVPNRSRTKGRNQLILDFSRKEVRDSIKNMIINILKDVKVDYIKWDMNRNMTEIGSLGLPIQRQRETAHRYILGLYEVLEDLVTKFPNILFESCSGGGGRFDPGMLYYMPQTWTSDNTDAVERLKIQFGTSMVYPPITMGSHVSAVPNHQVNRITPLEIRGHVAMSGNFGYELDLTKLLPDEKSDIKLQVKLYNSVRHLIQHGDFYRILSPFDGNETSWMFVSQDKSEAFVCYFKILAEPSEPIKKIKLKGLNPEYNYNIFQSDENLGGDLLMYSGIAIPKIYGDFKSIVWTLKAI